MKVHRYSTATVTAIREVKDLNKGHATQFVLATRPQAAVFGIYQGLDENEKRIVGMLLVGGTASQFDHSLEGHIAYQKVHDRVVGEAWHLAARGVYDSRGERLQDETKYQRGGPQATLNTWPEADLLYAGTCQRCGAYWDTRHHKTCPAVCGGQVL
jgi:hypothetical protein